MTAGRDGLAAAWLGVVVSLVACGRLDVTPRQDQGTDAGVDATPPTAPIHFTFEPPGFLAGGLIQARCNSCPEPSPGRPGRGDAARFSGGQDLTVSDDPALRWPALTVASWVRIDRLPADAATLASKQRDAINSNRNSWEMYLRSEGDLNLAIITDAGRTVINLLPDLGLVGAWHHVAHTYDGTRLRLYVDGALRGAAEAGTLDYDNSPFGFGHDVDLGSPVAYLEGALDDVMLFDRALTAAEVAALAAP